jgi:hypothetical protein
MNFSLANWTNWTWYNSSIIEDDDVFIPSPAHTLEVVRHMPTCLSLVKANLHLLLNPSINFVT